MAKSFVKDFGSLIRFSDLLKFSNVWWRQKGAKWIRMIQRDSKNGILQNPEKDHYRSEQYKNRKARRFNRVNGKGKLTGYSGHMSSTRTDSVDMRLSGRTMRGFHVAGSSSKSVDLAYPADSAMKIIGNEMLNRSVREFNNKNIDKVGRDYARELQRKISEAAKKETLIILNI